MRIYWRCLFLPTDGGAVDGGQLISTINNNITTRRSVILLGHFSASLLFMGICSNCKVYKCNIMYFRRTVAIVMDVYMKFYASTRAFGDGLKC